MSDEATKIADDLLRGADEIADFFYGAKEQRRKVYHLVATSHLPVFKLGSMICARKSVLLEWISDQESRHTGDRRERAAPGEPGCVEIRARQISRGEVAQQPARKFRNL